ncbi:hypothetical protein PVAND_009825 [Polypedilum vanderplanki]|uniref:Delta-aminolevulinic acid dehydratase n=1 Tax=Polypedilum vanderplanki TaxID=319348 RepID=A0A9J6CES1_POLVA|nr:hypothetical protein PVAND_009825 [Polypedilum vanderplanki]
MSAKNKLHSSQFHPLLRKFNEQNVDILPHNLMYPIFIVEDDSSQQVIPSMPSVYRFGLKKLIDHLTPLVELGLKSILVFGVIDTLTKDETGSNADSKKNPVIKALPILRKKFPELLIACDVCLCPYTDHGHCGIIEDGVINNEKSIERIANIALEYARHGAHIVAPSDMMDNRIFAIKSRLIENGMEKNCSVLSYSAKFASGFYGPFRDAAKSIPQQGDRKTYQLPAGSRGLAIRAVRRDVEEGADMLMVKPGISYLDIVRDVKNEFPEYPMFIYQVSGEYTMLVYGAKAGAFDLKTVLTEILVSMRRAGVDVIISYFTPNILEWMKEGSF